MIFPLLQRMRRVWVALQQANEGSESRKGDSVSLVHGVFQEWERKSLQEEGRQGPSQRVMGRENKFILLKITMKTITIATFIFKYLQYARHHFRVFTH